jgi:hypothetical protein
MKLVIRSVIRRDDWLVVDVEGEDRGLELFPDSIFAWIKELRIDGVRRSHENPPVATDAAGGGTLSLRTRGGLPMPGKHRVCCVVEQQVFNWSLGTALPVRQTVSLEADVVVRSEEDPDPIRRIPDDAVGAMLRMHLKLQHPQIFSIPPPIVLGLDQPAPMCLAFDVSVLSDQGESILGTLSWSKGASGAAQVQPLPSNSSVWPSPAAGQNPVLRGVWILYAGSDELIVKLRASREAASLSTDCYEVWDGAIEIGPVPGLLLDNAGPTRLGDFPQYDRYKLYGFPPDPAKAPIPNR